MANFEKTDISKSPLLKPVIERDYTKGLDNLNLDSPPPETQQQTQSQSQTQQQTGQPQAGHAPPRQEDFTKGFSFDEEPESLSDVSEGDSSDGVELPVGSAKTFANFAGDAVQLYLPKLTYSYCKIDIEDVIFNVQQGNLDNKWIDAFTRINENTEQGLQIPDESIKMWKKAFKDYLEYEKMSFANPRTTFIIASMVLLTDQGVRAYQIRKQNEKFMKEALEQSNPDEFVKFKNPEPDKQDKKENNGK